MDNTGSTKLISDHSSQPFLFFLHNHQVYYFYHYCSMDSFISSQPPAQCTILPKHIQHNILRYIIQSYENPGNKGYRLSNLATVCKDWQLIVEETTFRHLTLQPSDLNDFSLVSRPERRHCIDHILLEIPIQEELPPNTDPFSPYYENPSNIYRQRYRKHKSEENNASFTSAVDSLWIFLAGWESHQLIVEIGIIPPLHSGKDAVHFQQEYSSYSRHYRNPSSNVFLQHQRILQHPPDKPKHKAVWKRHKERLFGTQPLELSSKFMNQFIQEEECAYSRVDGYGERTLPQVSSIRCLLIRRRYFPVIGAKALSQITDAACLARIVHIEQWRFADPALNYEWDKGD